MSDLSAGGLLTRVADATPADGVRALDAEVEAAACLAAAAPRVRGEILPGAFGLVQEREEEFATLDDPGGGAHHRARR
ncbi:hypothetical protein BHD05_07170 [Marisediminicola antarctica]|uniref:Uncharacterized protein n=1 Tax=Marisediminicola antarctica TaxID=674079 RepID=A0A7L5AHE9_9MICO|nr:hypothetical protein BHD05_07170 [Marisediminicola antarctica]